MEFWGVEIKSGETIVVEKEGDKILHLSQASLGEVKKDRGTEPAYLFAKVGDQKFVIGILSSEKTPQLCLDVVFEKTFELSHNWKNGSVYFLGYKSSLGKEYELDAESDSEDEMVPIPIGPATINLQVIKETTDGDEKDSSSDDSTDESTESSSDNEQAKVKNEEESSGDDDESEDEESDDSEEEEEEESLNIVDTAKRRLAVVATKTSVAEKKAKLVTPEKSGAKTSGNKVVHVATPHPAKQAGKIAAKNDQPKQQTPKSGGAFACKSCNRSFGSDVALQSHTKAKHATGMKP